MIIVKMDFFIWCVFEDFKSLNVIICDICFYLLKEDKDDEIKRVDDLMLVRECNICFFSFKLSEDLILIYRRRIWFWF